MEPESLPLERCCPLLFKRPQVIFLKDGFVEGNGQLPCEHINGLQAIDVILGVLYELLKFGNVFIKILPLHFDSLA